MASYSPEICQFPWYHLGVNLRITRPTPRKVGQKLGPFRSHEALGARIPNADAVIRWGILTNGAWTTAPILGAIERVRAPTQEESECDKEKQRHNFFLTTYYSFLKVKPKQHCYSPHNSEKSNCFYNFDAATAFGFTGRIERE